MTTEEWNDIFPITKKQTVYLPTNDEYSEQYTDQILCDNQGGYLQNLNEKSGYFFTEEQLKQLLQNYTDKIVENAEVRYYKQDDSVAYVDRKSITNQLEPFLKDLL